MKIYPKQYDDIVKKPTPAIIAAMGSRYKTLPELVVLTGSFIRDAYDNIFNYLVKMVWISQQFTYAGARGRGRSKNGFGHDWGFSFFMRGMVGISQKALTTGLFFVTVPTYFKDFFPDFSDHNPFEEPEYFKFPYKHVTIDFLDYVSECHNRIELLNYAEEKKMNKIEFENWAYNQIM